MKGKIVITKLRIIVAVALAMVGTAVSASDVVEEGVMPAASRVRVEQDTTEAVADALQELYIGVSVKSLSAAQQRNVCGRLMQSFSPEALSEFVGSWDWCTQQRVFLALSQKIEVLSTALCTSAGEGEDETLRQSARQNIERVLFNVEGERIAYLKVLGQMLAESLGRDESDVADHAAELRQFASSLQQGERALEVPQSSDPVQERIIKCAGEVQEAKTVSELRQVAAQWDPMRVAARRGPGGSL